MSLINNSEIIGNSNKDLILETSGNLYIKVKEQLYKIDFRNINNVEKLIGTKVSEIKDDIKTPEIPAQKEIDLEDYITSYDLKQALKNYVTSKTFKDVQDTQEALINSKLDSFTESINPVTVQTMQVSVGSEQLQFQWIENFTSDKVVDDPLKIVDGDLIFTPGYIQHMTLDGPDKVAPSDSSYNNIRHYWRWFILNGNLKEESVKINIKSDKTYYVYLKVPNRTQAVIERKEVIIGVDDKPQTGLHGANVGLRWTYDSDGELNNDIAINDVTLKYNKVDATASTSRDPGLYCKTGIGYLYVTTESKKFDEEFDWYYLLYAIVTTKSGIPSISTMNGFTEITPGQIKAYLFSTPDGSSYIDLKNGTLKFSDKLQFDGENLTVDGEIKSKKGTIGGWVISDEGLSREGDKYSGSFLYPTEWYLIKNTSDTNKTSSRIYFGYPDMPAISGLPSYAGINVINENPEKLDTEAIVMNKGITSDAYSSPGDFEGFSFYSNFGVFGGFRPNIAYITPESGFITYMKDAFNGIYYSFDIPLDVSIIIVDYPDNYEIQLRLPETPEHGQYYKVINISSAKSTLHIKSTTSNIYIIDENKISDTISRTTRGVWEFFYVARYYKKSGSTDLGRWFTTYTKAN